MNTRPDQGLPLASAKTALDAFFFPIEQVALATFLNRRDELPDAVQKLNVHQTVDPDTWDESKNGFAPVEPCCDDFGNELTLQNAVARICLQNLQCQLPQWASGDRKTRELVFTRKTRKASALPTRVLVSRHLFEINWANSGPGFSWPQAYTATRIPGFDVVIVCASDDTPEIVGYCDYAIGFYPQSANDYENIHRIIVAYWRSLVDEYDQERWEELLGTGVIDEKSALAWADEVWSGPNSQPRNDETLPLF